jgi:DNA invertase Pin-like site-specific DNA recombinase
MMTARFIPYYRVSTKRQGKSGLGLEAQQMDVLKLIAESGGSEIAHYTEIETGKNPDRPELAKAIAHAKLSNATLVVAKLDRLARNVAFTAALMESTVDFVCCDCKGANTLTLHILAAVAQEEARLIGERTRKALAAAKARGLKLGSAREGAWAGREHLRGFKKATQRSAVKRRAETDKRYAYLVPKLMELRAAGRTLVEIAQWLNENGHFTRGGKTYTKPAVWRLFQRHAPECLGSINRFHTLENALAANCHAPISMHG